VHIGGFGADFHSIQTTQPLLQVSSARNNTLDFKRVNVATGLFSIHLFAYLCLVVSSMQQE
jgi:hypothetical protein